MLVLKLGSKGKKMGPYKYMYFGTDISQRTPIWVDIFIGVYVYSKGCGKCSKFSNTGCLPK